MIIRLRGNLSARHHIITGVGVGTGSVRGANQAPFNHIQYSIRQENESRRSHLRSKLQVNNGLQERL
jgi:hypothetical protein